jgi:manganese/zinc/iron transport system ATP- binding protein
MHTLSKTSALEISHLTVTYRNTIVLRDISVTIPHGVMLGIIGPNGAGKTTFIKSVLGLLPIVQGTITILGQPIKAVRKTIAYIAQRSSLDWDFPVTVFDMVLMGCYGKLGWFKRSSKLDHQNTYEVLKKVGLYEKADAPIGTLSGGQQQRAFLARALMQNAEIFFLDEPFAGVDITTEKILIKLFKELCAQGKTIIVVHHDLATVPAYFDYILLINKICIAYGPTKDVLTPPILQQTYGTSSNGILW